MSFRVLLPALAEKIVDTRLFFEETTFFKETLFKQTPCFFSKFQHPWKPRQPIGAQGNQMGDNLTAINLGTGASASQVVCGSGFTCALLSGSNSVKCWGRNHYGYLARFADEVCLGG